MIGIALVILGTLSEELGTVIGKKEVDDHKENIFSMTFVLILSGWVFFIISGLIKNDFVFSIQSIPTLLLRIFFELAECTLIALAITSGDRSTNSFLSMITIPLLLMVDIFLGYEISINHILAIVTIMGVITILFLNHDLKYKGAVYALLASIGAVGTISLYKYNITNFNSVSAEQTIVITAMLIYTFVMSKFMGHQNPFKIIKEPIIFLQSVVNGIGIILMSHAYVYAAPSVITTAKRAGRLLWSTLSGTLYFQEKHLDHKIIAFIIILLALVMLSM